MDTQHGRNRGVSGRILQTVCCIPNICMQFTLSCNSCVCEVSSCVVPSLSVNFCTENSSTRTSSLQFFHSMEQSRYEFFEVIFLVAPVLHTVELAFFGIVHTHNLNYPVPTSEKELVVEVHECKR